MAVNMKKIARAKCSICGRDRTPEDDLNYSAFQVIFGSPLGWYSGDDGEICPEDMTKIMSNQ